MNSVYEFRRRRAPESPPLPGTGGWVVFNGGKGKGKGGISNEGGDSEEVGGFPFPTVAPMPDNDAAGGASSPPAPINSKRPTVAPSTSLPTEPPPTEPPPTDPPTVSPTLSPEGAIQKAACEAAANSEVYSTETFVTVRFLYELLSPVDRPIAEVASNVDQRVQDFLVSELVDCQNGLTSIGGVGPGDVDAVVENECSELVPQESQTCHLMAGTVVLYLLSSGETNSQDGYFDRVAEELEVAFNGERRSLQSSFVDEELGILGLYYIGGHIDDEEEKDGSNKTEEGVASAVTGSGESVSSIPAVVIPVIVVACIAFVFVAIFVRRRRRQPYDPAKGVLLDGDDESSLEQEERWKEVAKSKDPLKVKVVEATDESESGSSGDAAVAAHEVVMADLTGMTVSESFSDTSLIPPVFVDPDSITLYTNSPRPSRYRERHYVVGDTVDI